MCGLQNSKHAYKQGEFEVENGDLERILGRKPTSVKAYLAMVYGA